MSGLLGHAFLPTILVAAACPCVTAQTVTFRIIERTGQSVVLCFSSDHTLDIAVQARVTGGGQLGGFSFDAVIAGESDANGTLAREEISNANGTYASGFTTGSTIGVHGLAKQFSYRAGINPNFNGLLNQSGGTFTNNPAQQEIGLIEGAAAGAALLGTPGLDLHNGDITPDPVNAPDGPDGIPDTWNAVHPWSSASGTAPSPADNATAALDTTIAGPYFGAAQFIDIYRFKYTVTNLSLRSLHFTLINLSAQIFNQLVFNNGSWSAQNSTFTGQITVTPTDISFGFCPAPSPAAAMGIAAMLGSRRRRSAS